ncbi:MAG: hypothetical protein KF752_15835 [Pirellulaceae bacterium]|nr:hypothetical protein [Pirellulaceae bacterium]
MFSSCVSRQSVLRSAKRCMMCAVVSYSALAYADDRVQLKQGQALQGSLVKITPNEVTITVRGKEQTHALKDVRKISFDKEPTGLDRARDLLIDGKYQQALDQLRTVPRDSLPDNPLLQLDYDFCQWFSEGMRSLSGSGDPTAAIKGLMSLDKAQPNSQHRWSIKLLLGRLALFKNAHAKATEYFTELAKSPDDIHRAAAQYFLARTLLEQGKATEARAQLKGLLAASASSPEMGRYKSLGNVLQARCDLLEGKAQEALQSLDGLAEREDNSDLQLFAEISNARGACYQQLNQPQRAAYSYLQTDLLFFTDAQAHAEALYHLKNLLTAVGQPAKAAQASQRLSSQYTSSVWANKP